MKTRSTFRRRKNGPDNSAYFGYRAARDPRNEAFFGTDRAFVESCNANRQHNRTLPLMTKHQPGETGRQLAARLRATDAHLRRSSRYRLRSQMIGLVFAAIGIAVNAVIWLAFRSRRTRDPRNINSEYEQ